MKLYEIPNYLEKKVRRKDHDEGYYIYFNNGAWLSETGFHYHIGDELNCNDWEEYVENPQRKRFWKWVIQEERGGRCFSYSSYLDENGLDTGTGNLLNSNWTLYKKKKCENDFIDCVLVDGKWELEG